MLKTKTKTTIGTISMFSVAIVTALLSCVLARGTFAENCTTSPCTTTFRVDVKEFLSVSITTPSGSYDKDKADELMTGQIDVTVSSNNAYGFATGVRASNAAATLVGSNGGTLSNLSSSNVLADDFPVGSWGYSLDASTYNPLTAYNVTPERISNISRSSSEGAGSKSGSIYLAAKAGYDDPAGTYAGSVNIVVVSGGNSPSPVNPVGPDNPSSTPTYHSAEDVTTYTTKTSTSSTETVNTEISSGDNTDAYADPQGETENTESNIQTNNSPLPVILAMTSAVSAAAGLGFFIVAKRREEKEEQEQELE